MFGRLFYISTGRVAVRGVRGRRARTGAMSKRTSASRFSTTVSSTADGGTGTPLSRRFSPLTLQGDESPSVTSYSFSSSTSSPPTLNTTLEKSGEKDDGKRAYDLEWTKDRTLRFKDIEFCDADSFHKTYEIMEMIGNGSYGEVFRVVHKEDGRERAVKVINNCDAHENEYAMTHRIHSLFDAPRVLRFDQVFVGEHNVRLVSDLWKEGDLLDFILEQKKQCSESVAATLTYNVLRCVSKCHAAGVAHLDLKPENLIFIDDHSFDLVLVDFGCAREMGSALESIADGQSTGTVGYIAPEVLRSEASTSSDLWSVGVVAYMLLTNKMPFTKGRRGIDDTLVGNFRTDREWEGLSPDAQDFVRRLLRTRPDTRMGIREAMSHPFILPARG